MSLELAKFIPWLPFLSAILCTICCMKKSLRGFAAPICIASIFGAFLIAVGISGEVQAFAASNDSKTDMAAHTASKAQASAIAPVRIKAPATRMAMAHRAMA